MVQDKSYTIIGHIPEQTLQSGQDHCRGGETYFLCATSHICFPAHFDINVVEHVHRNAGTQFFAVGQIHDAQFHACQRKKNLALTLH